LPERHFKAQEHGKVTNVTESGAIAVTLARMPVPESPEPVGMVHVCENRRSARL